MKMQFKKVEDNTHVIKEVSLKEAVQYVYDFVIKNSSLTPNLFLVEQNDDDADLVKILKSEVEKFTTDYRIFNHHLRWYLPESFELENKSPIIYIAPGKPSNRNNPDDFSREVKIGIIFYNDEYAVHPSAFVSTLLCIVNSGKQTEFLDMDRVGFHSKPNFSHFRK